MGGLLPLVEVLLQGVEAAGPQPAVGLEPRVRTVGARELVVGLGTLDALANAGDVSRWAVWNMVCDGTDAIGIVLAWRHVPRLRRVGVLASALAAVAASATSLAAAP